MGVRSVARNYSGWSCCEWGIQEKAVLDDPIPGDGGLSNRYVIVISLCTSSTQAPYTKHIPKMT